MEAVFCEEEIDGRMEFKWHMGIGRFGCEVRFFFEDHRAHRQHRPLWREFLAPPYVSCDVAYKLKIGKNSETGIQPLANIVQSLGLCSTNTTLKRRFPHSYKQWFVLLPSNVGHHIISSNNTQLIN